MPVIQIDSDNLFKLQKELDNLYNKKDRARARKGLQTPARYSRPVYQIQESPKKAASRQRKTKAEAVAPVAVPVPVPEAIETKTKRAHKTKEEAAPISVPVAVPVEVPAKKQRKAKTVA